MKSLKKKSILVIKFGGLGDFILSLPAIHSIKKHHKNDDIFLITEKPYAEIANKSNIFKEVILIKRSFFYFLDKINIQRKLRKKKINIVYDLQTSRRSSSYSSIFNLDDTAWSGIVKGSLYEHLNPLRNKMHTIERQREQLSLANVSSCKTQEDFTWLFNKKFNHRIQKPFSIIAPGGAAKRKYKRIPSEIFENIIFNLEKKKITPVLIGGIDEISLCQRIKKKCPNLIDLCCKTSILDLASLLKEAFVIIGNDSGPMHLGSFSGRKTLVFFTKYTNPRLCGPRGKDVKILKYDGKEKEFLKKVNNFLNSF